MRVYIRHSEKEYANGESFYNRHDPHLTEKGKEKAREVALALVEKWGYPSLIICSPYLRTRETALEMASVLNYATGIKCDVLLSEYLGNHQNEYLDVDESTSKYEPPHPENFYQMDNRVRYHNDIMLEYDGSEQVIWFITHGIIIGRLLKCFGITKKNIPYLGAVAISQNNNKPSFEYINPASIGIIFEKSNNYNRRKYRR